jgi:hypothetical protein
MIFGGLYRKECEYSGTKLFVIYMQVSKAQKVQAGADGRDAKCE